MSQVAFLFVTKPFAICDEKLNVARVRLIDVRVVNLVDDAMTKCEPETATGVVRSADALLRTRGPTRLDPRSAKRTVRIGVHHLNGYCSGACFFSIVKEEYSEEA